MQNQINSTSIRIAVYLLLVCAGISLSYAGWDSTSKASNTDSIVNTRHNLTMSYLTNTGCCIEGGVTRADNMNVARNAYGEVCVYCHTPHGANLDARAIGAPLWNRTISTATYTLYQGALLSGQTPTQPGVYSLMCLSCHDGTIAVDSVINMPGSNRFNQNQQTVVSDGFLDTWTNATGPNTTSHAVMSPVMDPSLPCASCHNGMGVNIGPADTCQKCHKAGMHSITGGTIADFNSFALGTDLTNDHPIGVQYAANISPALGYKIMDVTNAKMSFFDTNGSTRVDKNEIRVYNTGGVYEVECATCHDPHGVPSGGTGSVFIPAFLRVDNTGSALCLTCHDK